MKRYKWRTDFRHRGTNQRSVYTSKLISIHAQYCCYTFSIVKVTNVPHNSIHCESTISSLKPRTIVSGSGMPFSLPASPKSTLHTIACDSVTFVASFCCKGEHVLLSIGSAILSAAHIGCAYGLHHGKPSNKPQSIR